MKRNVLVLTLVLTLIASAAGGAIIFHRTRADPYITPEQPPSGYRIYSNGTYDAPNLREDGNLYTFTSDIQGTIVIERDGIVLDGAGYTLRGKGSSSGIWLQDKTNITIKNMDIRNFGYAVRFSHYVPDWHSGQTNPHYPTDCIIKLCNITNNTYGISLGESLNCNILDNFIVNNTKGITFGGSGHIFRNNKIEGNQYSFYDHDAGANDVDTSNTVNGKPICYWVNQHNLTVPDDAGLVILKKCSGIKVQNLNLTGQWNGLTLYYTNKSKIIGNSIFGNCLDGVALWGSCNNSIIGNKITENQRYGIYVYESENNSISNNFIKENSHGIEATSSRINMISSNQIIANRDGGIYCDSSNCELTDNYVFGNKELGISVGSNCIIARNNITLNQPDDIGFRGHGLLFVSNCTITANCISRNNFGIWTYDSYGSIIAGNMIAYNTREGIRFQGPAENNLIYRNNFIENNDDDTQAYINTALHDPAPNLWDNGVEGNYWSDYKSTPYFIAEKNQDNHPLTASIYFAPLKLPSIQQPQEEDTIPLQTPSSFIILLVTSIALAATVSVGLLVYFKKRNH